MAQFRTAQDINSLANGGYRAAFGSPISPGVLPPALWDRLVKDGAIVAVAPSSQPETAVTPLGELTIDELKAMADERGIAYTWNIKAETLRERLENA